MDENGEILDQNYSNRIIGLSLLDLKKAKCPIGIAGGHEKVEAIKAVLKNHLIKLLVTDEDTAGSLIGTHLKQKTNDLPPKNWSSY